MQTNLLLLFAMLGGFAITDADASPVPKHLLKGADNKEQAKLQGRWKLESVQYGGRPIGGEQGIEMTMEIRGDTVTSTTKWLTTTATIKLDKVDGVLRLALINSKAIDVKQQGPTVVENSQYGYTLDGDKLTLATNMIVGTKRSTAADPTKPAGDNTVLTVYTRIKETK
jgi:uncharacterized protein (TIGR03067 family)